MLLDHFEAAGSWYEMGRAEGEAYRDCLAYVLHLYACHHAGDVRRELLPEAVGQITAFLSANFPDELDNLRGIAAGANIPLPLILCANFPGVVNDLARARRRETETACSNIMFPDSEWGPLLGGTLDDNPTRIIATYRPTRGLALTGIRWPGILGLWGGMNSAGLALCGASAKALLPANRRNETRVAGLSMLVVPQQLILRSCHSVAEALAVIRNPKSGIVEHLSLLDASGAGVQIQGYYGDSVEPRVVPLPPDRGLACGNFYTWEIRPEDYLLFPDKADMFLRYAALQRVVNIHQGSYSVAQIQEALTGHGGNVVQGETVCNNGTMVAMVASPRERKLLFAAKPPCLNGFKEYPLPEGQEK